jgi:hypothetical protein
MYEVVPCQLSKKSVYERDRREEHSLLHRCIDLYFDCSYTYILSKAISCLLHSLAMINAVLVFNNSGQPRLTKFYTQLVNFPLL